MDLSLKYARTRGYFASDTSGMQKNGDFLTVAVSQEKRTHKVQLCFSATEQYREDHNPPEWGRTGSKEQSLGDSCWQFSCKRRKLFVKRWWQNSIVLGFWTSGILKEGCLKWTRDTLMYSSLRVTNSMDSKKSEKEIFQVCITLTEFLKLLS